MSDYGLLVGGRFLLGEIIGRGGMGVIHAAQGQHDGRRYAVKLLRAADGIDSMARRRFTREASNALRITHPNAVRTFAVGEQPDYAWMAMEFVDGRSLHQWVESEGRCEPALASAWIQQLADVLSHVHGIGIVHRDVKPSNVMVSGSGLEARLRLLDFGLARDVDNAAHVITRDGRAAGTPGFMAPEQRLGLPADSRADVFSLAALAAFILAGRMPVAAWAKPLETRMFGRRRRWPDPVDAVLSRALWPDPRQRTGNVQEFATEFARVITAPGWAERSPLIHWKKDTGLDARSITPLSEASDVDV
jgi:serine/threonine protein kinase